MFMPQKFQENLTIFFNLLIMVLVMLNYRVLSGYLYDILRSVINKAVTPDTIDKSATNAVWITYRDKKGLPGSRVFS